MEKIPSEKCGVCDKERSVRNIARVVHINTFPNKATGRIMLDIHKMLMENGYDSYVVWGRGRKAVTDNEILIEDKIGVYFHGIYSRLTDKAGFASKRATRKLIDKMDEIKPDLIHLHNLHGYYINIKLLFEYIKEHQIPFIWTLHDCWAFTGHCPHFEVVNCDKWKNGCFSCEQKKVYPKSICKSNAKRNWERKKELFTENKGIIIVPSKWLENLVKCSFLNQYDVYVINNGIDLNVFRPDSGYFREKYKLKNKFIVLGVASDWSVRKGYEDFIKLAQMLQRYQNIKIVMVGVTAGQKRKLSKEILAINRTDNVCDLVRIYSDADIFLNLTYEDTFPTTNMEALACGTPVITYRTGGSTEMITQKTGLVFEKGEIERIAGWIINHQEKKAGYQINLKHVELFKKEKMLNSYLEIYKKFGICDK